VVFAGTFTAGGLEVPVECGRLRIVREGRSRKFIDAVEQVTFSGSYAAETGQAVFYVTERCVLRRTAEGVELTEGAPGVDIGRDILANMGFRPVVHDPKPMDLRLFEPEPMGLEQQLRSLAGARGEELRLRNGNPRGSQGEQLRRIERPFQVRFWECHKATTFLVCVC